MSEFGRRELLRAGATTAAVAGFTGVTGASATAEQSLLTASSGQAQSDVPDWADWVPDPSTTDSELARAVWQYDMETVLTVEDVQADSESADPMKNPAAAGILAGFI